MLNGMSACAQCACRLSQSSPNQFSRLSLAFALGMLVSASNAQAWPYTVIDLGTLGGTSSAATAINATGQVTGSATTSNGAEHAFLYSSDGGMIDLGSLGGKNSSGHAINAAGQVTGFATTSDGAEHAFLYSSDGGMADLGTLGGFSSRAPTSMMQVRCLDTAPLVLVVVSRPTHFYIATAS